MRHRNIKSCSPYHNCHNISIPYLFTSSTFSKPTPKRRYIEVIQYVYDHPNCKRTDILRDVFKQNINLKDSWYKKLRACRGHQSSLFANLLYADLIDYDKHFNYNITKKGINFLIKCYKTKIDEINKPTQMLFDFMIK